MALKYIDGFDHYTNVDGTGIYTIIPNLWAIPSTGVAGRARIKTMPVLGGKGLTFDETGAITTITSAILTLPLSFASGSTLGIGFHFYLEQNNTSTNSGLLSFAAGSSTPTQSITVNSGVLHFRNGDTNATSVANSGANVLTAGNLYHIEMKIFLHASAGTIEIRVNGTPYLTGTGLNTLPTGATALVFGRIRASVSSGTYLAGTFDNLFIWDGTGSKNNDFLGERIVETLLPNADTAQADWTKSSGVNGYDLINDVPYNSANYIETSTVNAKSTFDLTALTSPGLTIAGVQSFFTGRKTDAGGAEVQVGVTSNAVESLGQNNVLIQDQSNLFYSIHESDPNTATDWTMSGVNAAQVTVKRAV